MLLGAAIFPQTSKYGGGPEKMAIVAARQRWRRCYRGGQTQRRFGCLQAAKLWRTYGQTEAEAAPEGFMMCVRG